MKLVRVGAYTSEVRGAAERVLRELRGLLSFSVKNGEEYEQLCLMAEDSTQFPTGLTPRVLSYLRRNGHDVGTASEVTPPAPDLEALDRLLIPLREYDQKPAVAKLLARPVGTLKGVTASGKGNMLAAVAACFPDQRIGIFAPTNELLDELENRLRTVAGVEPGYVTSKGIKRSRVCVMSFDKLTALRKSKPELYHKILQSLDVLLVDESHTAASPTRIRTVKACTNALVRYGFSATPEDRPDGYHCLTIGYLGPITATIEYEDLVAAKHVSKATVKMVVFHHDEPKQRNGYTHFYTANIQNNRARNDLIGKLMRMAGKPAMTFITRSRHGHILADMMKRARQFDAVFVDGKSKKQVIDKAIEDTRRGRIEILIASKKLDTGIDIPTLQTVVVADAGVSPIKSRQKAGRGMRKAEGKDEFTLIDIYDAGFRNRDGKPIAFERQAVDRMRTYIEAGFDVELVEYDEATASLTPYQN